jgi:DNA-binding response OmpR family regulator
MFKIFVVEDDKKICNIILENLLKWGYEGAAVEDFNNIFNEFTKCAPHLVLMDINLPFYDGFFWCNKIRQVSKVPIIFVSSRNSNMDIIMAVNMGGDDFITKPFSLEVLMAKINALLRRTYSYMESDTNAIEYGGVFLNLNDDTLLFGDNKIELTKNEFKILSLLMKNNGIIISRDRIMRALWEDESFVDDNTLTVNINRLRKKLNEIDLEDFIETKKNQGYIIS